MEKQKYNEVLEYVLSKKKPERFAGSRKRDSFKVWKRNIQRRYTFRVKKEGKEKLLLFKNLLLEDVHLIKKTFSRRERRNCFKIVVCEDEFQSIWNHFHVSNVTGGHRGLWQCVSAIRKNYFIPNLRNIITERLRKCSVCCQTRVKASPPPLFAVVPTEPLQIWQADYIGAFPDDSTNGHRYALVILDCFSKLMYLSTTPAQSDRHYTKSIEEFIELAGHPKRIHTDNGGPFVSQCKLKRISFC